MVGVVGVVGVEGAEGFVGLSLPQLLSIKDINKLATMSCFEVERIATVFKGILSRCVDKTTSKQFWLQEICQMCIKKLGKERCNNAELSGPTKFRTRSGVLLHLRNIRGNAD